MIELFQIYKDFYLFDIKENFIFIGLYFVIIFDITLGHFKAWANKDFNSYISRHGIVSHGALLVALNFVYPVLYHLKMHEIINSLMVLLSWSYLGSVIENFKALGGPVPKEIDDLLKKRKR